MRRGAGVFELNCCHITQDRLVDCDFFSHAFVHLLSQDNISRGELDNSEVWLNFIAEGHTWDQVDFMIRHLAKQYPQTKFGCIFCVPQDNVPSDWFPFIWSPWFLLQHTTWRRTQKIAPVDRPRQTKFVSLNRRPSLVREMLVSKLIANLSSQDLLVSIGSGNPLGTYYGPKKFVSTNLHIDGCVGNNLGIQDDRILGACFNIIAESSDQSDPHIWKSRFITEKTFKCITMYQLPVWMAVPGTVKLVREIGLDTFDDIIDHSYDLIEDEPKRCDAVIAEVKRLDLKYSLADCNDLILSLQSRLEHNFNLIAAHCSRQSWQDIQELIKDSTTRN